MWKTPAMHRSNRPVIMASSNAWQRQECDHHHVLLALSVSLVGTDHASLPLMVWREARNPTSYLSADNCCALYSSPVILRENLTTGPDVRPSPMQLNSMDMSWVCSVQLRWRFWQTGLTFASRDSSAQASPNRWQSWSLRSWNWT